MENSKIRQVFDHKGFPILAGLFLVLFAWEGKHGLRKRVEPRTRRAITNSLVAIPGFSIMRLLVLPVMVSLAVRNEKVGKGLLYKLKIPSPAREIIGFVLLDYTNYLWHLLNHKLPLLWRFHLVHHTDHDLDITTAFRFHFGEMIGSLFYRSACVVIIGASSLTVLVYEIVFEGATQFHHSNVRLSNKIEKLLNNLIVTPGMHRIHHSIVNRETNSNFSVIFSIWDKLHNTWQRYIKQQHIVIGVPDYRDPKELTASFLLRMPFTEMRSR